MRTRLMTKVLLTLGVLLALGMLTLAQSLPRLPKDYTFPQSGDSPGKVTFSHASHVDAAKPSCTTCHPALFKILVPGSTADGKRITHAAMLKRQQCGRCHDGKTSFAFDDCTICHR